MDPHLLSPGQVAGILSISTRTLRRWSTAFKAALSSSARRQGRKRAYSSRDVDALRRAQAELDQGRSLAEVARSLSVVDREVPGTALMLSPEQNIALGQALERTARMAESVTDHDQRLADLEAWTRQPWWRRIFGPPPRP